MQKRNIERLCSYEANHIQPKEYIRHTNPSRGRGLEKMHTDRESPEIGEKCVIKSNRLKNSFNVEKNVASISSE